LRPAPAQMSILGGLRICVKIALPAGGYLLIKFLVFDGPSSPPSGMTKRFDTQEPSLQWKEGAAWLAEHADLLQGSPLRSNVQSWASGHAIIFPMRASRETWSSAFSRLIKMADPREETSQITKPLIESWQRQHADELSSGDLPVTWPSPSSSA
jgi:hypothetical protein